MFGGFPIQERVAINVIGHSAGLLVFGNFLFLVLWNRPGRRAYTSKLAIAAAALAFVWNLASLAGIAIGNDASISGRIASAVAFGSLSLLPAVLLNICLVGRLQLAVRTGYVLSCVAMAAHVVEVVHNAAAYHRFGLSLITFGFGALTIAAVAKLIRSGADNPRVTSSRLLAAMSLFLFAISFVHFSSGEDPAWATELAVHHAGIPLALFILIQDYRFVFLDALIRFLANGLLALIFAVVTVVSSDELSWPAQVVVASAMLAGFALARGLALRFLNRIVFREVDVDRVIVSLGGLASQAVDEHDYIQRAFQQVAAVLNAHAIDGIDIETDVSSVFLPTLVAALPDPRRVGELGVEVIVPVRMSNSTEMVFLGERRSGRRYLSGDLEMLTRVAAYIGQEADRIREAEVRRLVAVAEFRALQAQIHPHFLFNALNTLYGIIPREGKEAREMLLSLAEMLRYFLRSERTYISLAEELRVVKAYLSIEEVRLGNRLRTRIELDDGISGTLIPALSVEPLVENAVKHGIAARPAGGEVSVEIRRVGDGVRIRVRDTGRGFADNEQSPQHAGIGLKNLSRRLELCYGETSRLEMESSPEGASIGFWVPFSQAGTGAAGQVRLPLISARS